MTNGNLARVMKPPLIDKQENNRTPKQGKFLSRESAGRLAGRDIFKWPGRRRLVAGGAGYEQTPQQGGRRAAGFQSDLEAWLKSAKAPSLVLARWRTIIARASCDIHLTRRWKMTLPENLRVVNDSRRNATRQSIAYM
jgi:hypothetical protein